MKRHLNLYIHKAPKKNLSLYTSATVAVPQRKSQVKRRVSKVVLEVPAWDPETSSNSYLIESGAWSSVTWYMDTKKEFSPDLNLKVPDTEFSKLKIHGNREILSKSQFDISVGIGFSPQDLALFAGDTCTRLTWHVLFIFQLVNILWTELKELCANPDLDKLNHNLSCRNLK